MKVCCIALALLLLAGLPATSTAQDAATDAGATTGPAEPSEQRRLEPLTPEQQTRLCDQAKALLDAGYAAEAEALYKALLGRAPCANAGTKAAAAEQERTAADERKAARDSPSACIVGKAFEDAGLEDDARSAYKKAIEANGATCAVNALKRLGDKDLAERTDDLLAMVAKLLGVVAAVVGLALLLAYLLAISLGRVRGVRALWPLNRIRRPSLEVEPLDDSALEKDLGKAPATLIRGRISASRRYGDSLSVVSGQASVAAQLKNLSELNAQLKAIVTAITILDRALPRRRFRLEGVLQPKQNDLGSGISITLKDNETPRGGFTHWARAYDIPATGGDADVYRRLTAPAAAWAEHMIALRLKASRLVTRDSLSYALLQAGLERLTEDDHTKAKELYEAALKRDPSNTGAMVNLGLLEAQAANDTVAEALFQRARDRLEEEDL